ncbi:MAG: glycerol kinase GlpK, partial [Clostridia bacterium]
TGAMRCHVERTHAQLIDSRGYIEHDPEEIYGNVITLARQLLEQSRVSPGDVLAVGLTNQRETALAWYRDTGKPACNAIVWQCARGETLCERLRGQGVEESVRTRTGLHLSPYFSAAKWAWMLENIEGLREQAERGDVLLGTMDSYLLYRLTDGCEFRTDASNAARTQLLNLHTLSWDEELLRLFGIPARCMARLTDSDGAFGETDFCGVLPRKIPIRCVMGDSNASLFGHGCLARGMMKASYGTGSSIMMNVGEAPVMSREGLVTSLAWKQNGRVQYVLEGNVNYVGAVITWLKDDLGLLQNAAESETLARSANPQDRTYLVPAFSGLGAPYWRSDVSAAFVGMSRTTGSKELVRAGLSSIAYQVEDVVRLMRREAGVDALELHADSGASRNGYLMQLQSDLLGFPVLVSDNQAMTGMGVAFGAGLAISLYTPDVFAQNRYRCYTPTMDEKTRAEQYEGWQTAVRTVMR